MGFIIGVDPGETTGWALISPEGVIQNLGQVKYDDLHLWIESLHSNIDTMVIENFRIRPNVNFTWSEMKTIKVIGALEFRAYLINAKVVFQEPASYKIGARWAGVAIPKNHDISHQVIAYAHATFYSVHVLKNPIPAVQQMKADS